MVVMSEGGHGGDVRGRSWRRCRREVMVVMSEGGHGEDVGGRSWW